MATRICPSGSTVASLTPARVATWTTGPLASDSSIRKRTKTRTPLPHISAIEPSALR